MFKIVKNRTIEIIIGTIIVAGIIGQTIYLIKEKIYRMIK